MGSLREYCVIGVAVSCVSWTAGLGQAQQLGSPWAFSVRVGAVFDDNRDGTSSNKQSNLDGFVQPSAAYLYQDADRTSVRLTLTPEMRWHSNPRPAAKGATQRDTDLFGSAGLELMHRLTPTVTLNAGDQVAYTDDPEIADSGTTVRRAQSYIRNSAHAGVDTVLTPETGFGISGGSVSTRYEDDVVARESDSDTFSGQVAPRYVVGSGWTALGLVGLSKFQVEGTKRDRGYDSMIYNGGFEKTFTPDFVGKVMGGYQVVQYDDPDLGSSAEMNGNAELTYRATERTRCDVSVGYGYTPPSDSSYSAQKATTVSAAVDHDVLAERLTAGLQGQYTDSRYKREGEDAQGGSEQMTRIGVHGTYRLSIRWSLTSDYSYEYWESDVRESFTRNRVGMSVSAAW